MYAKILKLAVPAILNNIVRMLMEVINLSMIGHLNNPAMVAGVGMGNMTINMLGLSLIMGFNSALDTLISQGAGANRLELCGVFRNRGMFFVCLLFIPIFIVLRNSYFILVTIGQHKDVAKYSQEYILAFLPGLFLNAIGECQLRFLNNLGKTQISFFCSFVGVAIHLVCSYFLVIEWNYGLQGTGISLSIAYLVMLLQMLIYAYFQDDIKEAMFCPDLRVFEDLGAYFWLGLPSAIMIVLDQWAYEILILLAGLWTVEEQAA